MKKNFILFALMVFLPVLAFAQSVTLRYGNTDAPQNQEFTYDGGNHKPSNIGYDTNNGNYTTGTSNSTAQIEWQQGSTTYTYTYKKNAQSEPQTLSANDQFVNAGIYTITVSRNYRTRTRNNTRSEWRNWSSYQPATSSCTITINPKDIADESVTVTPIANQPFTGQAIEPVFTVQDGSAELAGEKYVSGQTPADVDYSYDYINNTQVGTAKISIYGLGNYTGSREVEFSIYNPSGAPTIFGKTVNFTFDETPTYNGSEWYPATISIEGVGTLRKGNVRGAIPTYTGDTDKFEVVSVVNNINAGLATVTLAGTGDYEGQAQGTFPIAQQPLTGATITLSAASVEYNGTSTTVGINSVVADGKTLVPGVDYLVYGYKYNAKNADTEAVPGHVGDKWYVVIGPAAGSNYTAEAVSENSFAVTKRALKIDLLEIHKIYGDADPDLANIDINEWASINWAPGDGPSNTTISPIEFERLTVGENVYDENGNRNAFEYSLKNPRNLTATTTIGGVGYENYTVGVGQSSSLLIDKKPISISVTNNSKNFFEADPEPFKYNNNTAMKNQLVEADKPKASGTPGQDDVIISITRAKGEDAGSYAFTAESNNYEVTVTNNFVINPIDLSGIEFKFNNNNNKFQYTGLRQIPTPTVSYTKNGKTMVLQLGRDFTIDEAGSGTNKNVNDANIFVKIVGTGNFGKTGNGTTHTKNLAFTITKAPLTIGVVPQEFNTGDTPNDNDYEFEYTKNGFVGDDATTFPTTAYFTKPTGIEILPTSITGVFELKPNHDATAVNYEISYNDKNLRTFGVKQLFIAANDKTQVYGDAAIALTTDDVTITGFPANMTQTQKDQVLKPAGKCVYTVTRQEGTDAGVYDIIVDGIRAVEGYVITYYDGTYTITKRPVTIVAVDKEKTYGDIDPELEVIVNNLAAGDDPEDALNVTVNTWYGSSTEEVYSISRESGETARPKANPNNNYYAINVTISRQYVNANPNYTYGGTYGNNQLAATQSGKFNINKKELIIKANPASKTYGTYLTEAEENQLLTVTVEGIVNRSLLERILGYPNIQDTEASVLGSGNNTIYVVTRDHGPKNNSGAYTKYREYENVKEGGYTITVANRYNPARVLTNYTYKYEPATNIFTINPKTLKVTADDQGIGYGKEIDKYAVKIEGYNDGEVLNGDYILEIDDKVKDVIELACDITKVGPHFASENPYTYTLKSSNYVIGSFTQGNLAINGLKTIPLGKADLAKITSRTLSQVLEDHKNAVVDVVLPSDRSMAANDWYSWVLPFAVTPRMLSRDNTWGYAAVDVLDEAKSVGKSIVFKLTVNEIPANTPFLVKVDKDITQENMGKITFKNVTIADGVDYASGKVAVGNEGSVQFVGLYEPVDGLTASDRYLTRNTTIDPARAFYVGDDEAKLSQTRAYLHFASAEQSANARIYVQEADGSTTAIDGVNAEAEAEAADGWYTINGVKLEGEPTVSGTYIFNGKKVFIQK